MSARAVRALAGAALFAAVAAAQAPIVHTILANGPSSNRYDMVILGDGYTAAEQAHFDSDCTAFLTALFQKQPYQTFANYYNVHSVFRASAQSGANQPDVLPPIVVNNAYGSTFNTGGVARCLYITNTTLALQDAALAPANEGRVIVLVNTSRYGGCGAQFSVSYNGSSMTEVQIHEIGHSLGGLADEYDYANQTYSGPEPAEHNITTSPVGQKWSIWWGFDGVSAFQGAGYNQFGLWRPKADCLMRTLGIPLCPICKEQLTLATSSVVNVIENPLPASTSVTVSFPNTQAFSFADLVPAANAPTVVWKVDGQVQAGRTGTSFTFDPATVANGAHTVAVEVTDHTAMVRSDPSSILRDTRTWNVSVVDPTACDLRVSALQTSATFAAPGQGIDLTTTVVNDGPAGSPPTTVEHFLSTDGTLSPATDLYLGGYQIGALGIGQGDTRAHHVTMPLLLEGRVYYLFAVVDRSNAVRENSESNNTRWIAEVGQLVGCPTGLEFDDALLSPRDAATVSIAGGGTVHPTVVARCAAPGTSYLIVWGCQGTVPGTVVAPGVTIPLNQDLCTQIGLNEVNGPVFQQFWGTLDAQGVGRGTFAWPAGLNMRPMTGHFAALLLDGTPAFVAATNPVAIAIQ